MIGPEANHPASGKAGIALLFAFGHHYRGCASAFR